MLQEYSCIPQYCENLKSLAHSSSVYVLQIIESTKMNEIALFVIFVIIIFDLTVNKTNFHTIILHFHTYNKVPLQSIQIS